MIPADYLTWSRHLLVSCPFFPPHLSPPPWMVKADPEMLTIPLKECRRRIAWPYSRVLWPPPCAACGEGGQETSAPARHGFSDGKAAQEFLGDRLQRKDPRRSSQGIHSRSEWPAYRRGVGVGGWGAGRRLVTTAMQHPWESVCGASSWKQPLPGISGNAEPFY